MADSEPELYLRIMAKVFAHKVRLFESCNVPMPPKAVRLAKKISCNAKMFGQWCDRISLDDIATTCRILTSQLGRLGCYLISDDEIPEWDYLLYEIDQLLVDSHILRDGIKREKRRLRKKSKREEGTLQQEKEAKLKEYVDRYSKSCFN